MSLSLSRPELTALHWHGVSHHGGTTRAHGPAEAMRSNLNDNDNDNDGDNDGDCDACIRARWECGVEENREKREEEVQERASCE